MMPMGQLTPPGERVLSSGQRWHNNPLLTLKAQLQAHLLKVELNKGGRTRPLCLRLFFWSAYASFFGPPLSDADDLAKQRE